VRPSGDVECLECLVGEVQDVPAIQVAVVSGCREEQICHLGVISPGPHRRDDAALGPF
jgi:hypothetical protein